MKHRSFDSGNHRMLVIQYVCCLPMNSVNTCFMLHLFSKYQRYDKYICSINREIPCIWRSVFRNCLISGNRLSRQQSLLLLFFFIISNSFVNKFLWTQPQWWILILCQIHQRSRPYIYCIDFGLSVFLFVLLSVAASKLLSYKKCRRMPRLHMMNNEKKWPGKFKVIDQVQGQTEHQNVN